MSKQRVVQFTNCQLIKADGIEYGSDFYVRGGQISDKVEHADIRIDLKKLYISPGYIDLQLNGECLRDSNKTWVYWFFFGYF